MLLAIDVGNTNTTFAVFDGKTLMADWRIGTVSRRTADEYAALLLMLCGEKGLAFSAIDGAAISSVVPSAIDALVKLAQKHLNIQSPLVLSSDLDLGINIHYSPITDVGPDRIANAVAARAKYGGKVIVVDFGTATTLDAVSEDGCYLGGAIAPGIQVSLEALLSRAARLTGVQITAPKKAIGDSTLASLQSGIVYGTAGQVDALVERFQEEMGGGAKVIATGGLAELISPYSSTIESTDPLLTLEGLRIVYERTRK